MMGQTTLNVDGMASLDRTMGRLTLKTIAKIQQNTIDLKN